MPKIPCNFRLSSEAVKILKETAARTKQSQAEVIEDWALEESQARVDGPERTMATVHPQNTETCAESIFAKLDPKDFQKPDPVRFPVGGYPIKPVDIPGKTDPRPTLETFNAEIKAENEAFRDAPLIQRSRMTARTNAQPLTRTVQKHEVKE